MGDKFNNVIDVKYLIKNIEEDSFINAVDFLENNHILFEGQFPFLNDAIMRDRNKDQIKEILSRFGFESTTKLHSLAFEIPNLGYKRVIFFFGEKYETINDVKKAAQDFFDIQKKE